MKNVIKTQSKLAKFMAAVSWFALGCTAIGGNALAQQSAAAEAPPASQSVSHWPEAYPVGYSDLDVSTMKGAKILYLRIRYAAETLCESAATWGKKEGEACVRKAVNDAVARVNVPLLTQYSCAARVIKRDSYSWQKPIDSSIAMPRSGALLRGII